MWAYGEGKFLTDIQIAFMKALMVTSRQISQVAHMGTYLLRMNQ